MNQRTLEWQAARLGKITGTRAADLMGTAKAQMTLLASIIRENATAEQKEFTPTRDMQRGIDLEPEALSYYEMKNDVDVTTVGIVELDNLCACSPDGLIGDNGGIEIKCLNEENHLKVLIQDEIEKKYYYQIMWNIFVTGAEWWDYFGYCPSLPEPLTTYTKRLYLSDEERKNIVERVNKFRSKLTETMERLGLSL